MPEEKAYFAAVQYSNLDVAREIFTRPDDRKRWIEQHRSGRVFEGIRVISITEAEGIWVAVEEGQES